PRALPRDRADEHESRPRLVPPAPARPCDPPRRARPRVGRGGRPGASGRAEVRRLCVALVVLAAAGGGEAHAATGSWIGSIRLPATADPVEVLVRVAGTRATVSMGYG